MDANCSYIYEPSPLLVLPERKTSARCPASKWHHQTKTTKTPLLFDEDIVVLENEPGTWSWNRVRTSSPMNKHSKKINYLFEDGIKEESDQKPNIRTPVSSVAIQVGTRRKPTYTKDVSTSVDKLPAQEAMDAYFSEHPFLDLLGSCGGIMVFAVFLYYTITWYSWIIQCVQS
ncbi:hypothetical protein RB195_004891 [Necator americanus]|uniref:Uncharacterized protein n=1 Tax=Necator americanus TaxID=51031 RepID=A0ABR1BK78_NECAM